MSYCLKVANFAAPKATFELASDVGKLAYESVNGDFLETGLQ